VDSSIKTAGWQLMNIIGDHYMAEY
jgi:hypothetical protein